MRTGDRPSSRTPDDTNGLERRNFACVMHVVRNQSQLVQLSGAFDS